MAARPAAILCRTHTCDANVVTQYKSFVLPLGAHSWICGEVSVVRATAIRAFVFVAAAWWSLWPRAEDLNVLFCLLQVTVARRRLTQRGL